MLTGVWLRDEVYWQTAANGTWSSGACLSSRRSPRLETAPGQLLLFLRNLGIMGRRRRRLADAS